MTNSLPWYVARATGLVAWGLLAFGVFLGLALSTGITRGKPKPKWLLDLHRFSGALSVVFVAGHIVGLMLDHFVHFGLTEVFVPLASTFRPGPVAAGVVSLYLLLAVEVTSLVQRRIPRRWWRAVHSTSFALFLVATAHVVTAGTDARNRAVVAAVLALAATFVFLVTFRSLAGRAATARRDATMAVVRDRAETEAAA